MKESDAQYEQVKSRLEELANANQRLSEQVKRLLKTEHELHQTKEQLDTQILLYRQLHEFGNKFNATFDLAEVLHIATEFVLYELNFERCLVLLRSEEAKDFCVQALDGYYDEDARQSVAEMSLSVEEPALLPLYSDLGQVMCMAGCDQEHLLALGRAFEMAEYVIFPLGGESQNPIGLLVAGNTADNLPYHTRVQPDSEFVVGLANLASMATTTIHNVNFYQALRESEQRYRTLFDGVPVGLYRTTPAGQFLDANLAMVQMLGYPSREDLLAINTASLYADPEERVRWKALMEREGVVRDFEIRNRRYDGTVIWVNNTARAVKDGRGQVLYYEGSIEDITERKEAEAELRKYQEHLEELVEERTAELRESEERYRTLFDGVPVGLFRATLAGEITEANVAMVQMLGYPSREDVLAMDASSLYVDLEERVPGKALMEREGVVRDVETQVYQHDGAVIWVSYTGRAVRDEQGRVLYYEGSLADITERKKLEEEIRRQKDYYEALFVNNPVAVLTADLDGTVVSWNPMAEKLFGYTQEEAIGKNADDLVAKDDSIRGEAVGYTHQVIHLGLERLQVATKRTRKDGSLVDVEVLGLPIIVAGEKVGFIAIYHDITERKRFEEEIRRQKEYFEALLVNSPVAVLTADLDANVVSWNPMAEKLFGYSQEEAIGRNVDDLVANDPRIREEALRYTDQILTMGRIQATTKRTRKDGSLIDVEVQALPVMVAGELVGYVAIYHDIGELQKARREAEQASQAKSAFLATMSHEIRTPMNAVIGMTSLLLDTDLTPEQRGFTETIRTSGDTLLTIINDILDFSKIEAGKLELENQPFDLRDCVEGALDLVATRAAEKELDLAYFIETSCPAAIFGDVTRLRQILVNLLSNAVKFTEEGEVVVSVASRLPEDAVLGGATELLFAVRDTGVGIPADRMDRLFQSFSQMDTSTTRRYGGTGLGLAISKRLSEMMGGTIWAESDGVPGKGSTFHFTIQAEAAPSPPRAYLQAAQPDLSGKRVLIVDDNATNRQILTLQTRAWGMLPRDTGSPTEALDWIRRGPFDVAVLDMQMPEMDGLMLAAEIRRERDSQALPLVMLTSGQREADTEGIELAAFLTKPIKASQLYNVLVGLFAEEARPIEKPDGAPLSRQFDAGMGQRLPLRILLAEDNAVNQQVALSFLERLGYRADVAANGLEVLRSLRRQPYDVVLMDVHMPEMDGLEATRRIRQELAAEAQPRIVAMTADAMREDREACLAAGMEDYISKPVQVGELVAALSKCQPRLPMKARKPSEVVESPATPLAPEVLDPGALKLLRATLGKKADRMLPGLIERFYEDVDRLLGEARQALEQGQAADLHRAAHTLKSTSATFGAVALSEVARELEYLARDGVLEGAAGLIAQAEAEFVKAKAALATIAAQAPPCGTGETKRKEL